MGAILEKQTRYQRLFQHSDFRGTLTMPWLLNVINNLGSCWIPGSYAPRKWVKCLILNNFFEGYRIGRDLREKAVKSICYAKLNRPRPRNPTWAIIYISIIMKNTVNVKKNFWILVQRGSGGLKNCAKIFFTYDWNVQYLAQTKFTENCWTS